MHMFVSLRVGSKRGWALLVGALALAAVLIVAATRSMMNEPIVGGPHRFTVESGASLRPLLMELAEQGAIHHPMWIYYYARARGQTAIRAGDYLLKSGDTPRDLVAMMIEGRAVHEAFSIPEGLNRWQIRDLLAKDGWIDAESFDALCDDTDFLDNEGIPGPSCEGYLFPETYYFARGVSAKQIFKTMLAEFRLRFEEVIGEHGSGPLELDVRRLTTLASIVEKETGDERERPHIACVFYNRLNAEPVMRLQTDPTVIYAATLSDPHFDGNIRSFHLHKFKHPYNTYQTEGLPPGPIASPGRAALEAVSQPAHCDDYFFVSMNNGRHVFCPTYECHSKNVKKWQIEFFRDR